MKSFFSPVVFASFVIAIVAAALVFYIVRLRRVFSCVPTALGGPNAKRLAAGAAMRSVSFVLLSLSFAGITGNKRSTPSGGVPSRGEAGDAVALVFDISYSMNALDAGSAQYQVSRLDAAAQFARMVIAALPAAPMSAVLAKGDGLVAVPLTDDKEAIDAMLSSLSPALMSAVGTRLGAGIAAAESTFPDDVDFRRHIWLFTDGDETDGSLAESAEKAAKHGSNVVFVGFGSEEGCKVVTGDGKTEVHTALKSGALKAIADNASASLGGSAKVRYIASNAKGAASSLVSSLNGSTVAPNTDATESAAGGSALILCAIALFALSFLVTELSPGNLMLRKRSKAAMAMIVLTAFFAGCSTGQSTAETLKGAWAWRQGKMQKAVASFMRVLYSAKQSDSEENAQYALYNVSAAYISMGEYDAAISRLDELTDNAPAPVQYAASFNRGVVAFSRGEYDKAVEYFRLALVADDTSLQAKENLEIAVAALKEAAAREQSLPPSLGKESKNDRAADALFDKVREQDRRQWKSREQSTSQPSSADY